MKDIHLTIIVFALLATSLVGPSAGYTPHIGSSAMAPRTSRTTEAPQLTESRLFFKGNPVDQIVSGNKIKRYSIELTGTGFVSGSTVIITSTRAFADDFLNEQEQRIATTYESATDLLVQFVHKKVPPAGLLLIKVVNPDGQESSTLAVDVVSPASELSITSISQESGPTGTLITLRGVGFASSSVPPSTAVRFPSAIRFTAVGSEPTSSAIFFVGFYIESPANDNMLTIFVPVDVIVPICTGAKFVCDPIRSPFVTPQRYRIQVINPNGMSNSVFFQVTP